MLEPVSAARLACDLVARSPWLKNRLQRLRVRGDRPDWGKVQGVDSLPAVQQATAGTVLIATSLGAQLDVAVLESVLAAALRLRDAEVHVLLCDAVLPACHLGALQGFRNAASMERDGPKKLLCPGCFGPAATMFGKLGVKVLRYSEFLDADDRRFARDLARSVPFDEIGNVTVGSVAIGEHAVAGALRFFARATVDDEPGAEAIFRRYLEAACLTARTIHNLLDEHSYTRAVFHHGIYVPQGVIGEVARARGVGVVNWNPAYRSKSFIFSHDDTYHRTMMSEPTETWERLDLDDERKAILTDYLRSRWTGGRDWISFNRNPIGELAAITAETGVDFSRPIVGMLTNVMWDAQLHYPANAFPNMLEWCVDTIRYFAGRPDLQLLIRVHPAELTGSLRSRQHVTEEIARAFPSLPSNVFVLGPESTASTYVAMMECDSVIIYGTKTGVELTAMGIPVVVAGEAWIRNKGITMDAYDRQGYLDILRTLPLGKRLDESTVARARKYAYHFFFRRMIPLDFMEPGRTTLARCDISYLAQLSPGQSAGLDVICDGILSGTPFVYDGDSKTRGSARTGVPQVWSTRRHEHGL